MEDEYEDEDMVRDDNDYRDGEADSFADDESGEEGPPRKRTRGDERYAIPTPEEASKLRETEGLFHSNLLVLEVEELLKEVRVDHSKKSISRLQEWLHKLRDAIKSLPPATVTEKSLGLAGIQLVNHVPEKPVTLSFHPPEADGFHLAGSFLLKALARPSLNVDITLRIPDGCLVPRDSLNHRYLDKRTLFAGHIAKVALDRGGAVGRLVDRVE
ncbi:unnamed protein product, partial [Discosporangium mesarthrocarpum]